MHRGSGGPGTDPSAHAVQRGLAFLATRQHQDGSYGTDVYQGHVAVTAFVSRAMMASGSKPGEGPYGQRLSKSLAYLLGRVQQSGLITSKDANEPAPMYGHAFGLMYLAECQKATPNGDLQGKIGRAVQLIVKSQNKEGGWRIRPKPGDADVSVTVTQLMALSAVRDAGLDAPNEVIDRAIDYVKKSQNRRRRFPLFAARWHERLCPFGSGRDGALLCRGRRLRGGSQGIRLRSQVPGRRDGWPAGGLLLLRRLLCGPSDVSCR